MILRKNTAVAVALLLLMTGCGKGKKDHAEDLSRSEEHSDHTEQFDIPCPDHSGREQKSRDGKRNKHTGQSGGQGSRKTRHCRKYEGTDGPGQHQTVWDPPGPDIADGCHGRQNAKD